MSEHCMHWRDGKSSCCQCGEKVGGDAFCPDAAIVRAMTRASKTAKVAKRRLGSRR